MSVETEEDRLTQDAERVITREAELRNSLADVLALARIKWGNLDPDATTVFERAETLLLRPVNIIDIIDKTVKSIFRVNERLLRRSASAEREIESELEKELDAEQERRAGEQHVREILRQCRLNGAQVDAVMRSVEASRLNVERMVAKGSAYKLWEDMTWKPTRSG